MFIGEYRHNIDGKGRLAVPAKFRHLLSNGIIITRGIIDKCLFGYTLEQWSQIADKVSSMPIAKADSLAFNRFMFAGARDMALDAQGRVLIPEYLRKYAGLSKEAIVVGVYNRFEIWDKEKWELYRSKIEENNQEIAERLENI